MIPLFGSQGYFSAIGLHGFARVRLQVVGIDIDWLTGRDLSEGDEPTTQRGLEVQSILHRDVLEETVLGDR